MSRTDESRKFGEIIQRSWRLGALLAVVLALASAGRAQSAAPSSKPAPVIDASPATKPATAVVFAKPVAAETLQQRAKSPREGIKVSGYWTIEVRNPDGKLAKRIEFENSLCPTTGATAGAFAGDTILAGLLTSTLTVGPWSIELGNPPLPSPSTSNPPPPCALQFPSGLFTLYQASNGVPEFCPGASNPTSGLSCFNTLNAPALSAQQNVITLSGQFTVPLGSASTTITAVSTAVAVCSGNTACVAQGSSSYEPYQFTGAYLTGVSPLPPALAVVAGQVVSVTVQLSFS